MSGLNMRVMGAAASSLSLLRLFGIVSLLVFSLYSTGETNERKLELMKKVLAEEKAEKSNNGVA